MAEFIQSWMYVALIIAFVLGWIAGFVLAIIIAASGNVSRMEERISDEVIYEATKREERRRNGEYQLVGIKIATQGKPEDA